MGTVEDIYRNVGSGETAYDASLRDLARTRGGIMAHLVANTFFYPALSEDFSEASVIPSEPLVALLLGLMGAAVVFAARQLRPRRRVRAHRAPQPA